jgi:hypothetical protein
MPKTVPPAEKSRPSSVKASPVLETPSRSPARIRDIFDMVWFFSQARI